MVETLTPAQEQALREEVRSWRRPADHFVYELVVVGSAEEAVIAAQPNASLQACVICRRLAAAAGHQEPGLAPFADRGLAGELDGLDPDERQIPAAVKSQPAARAAGGRPLRWRRGVRG